MSGDGKYLLYGLVSCTDPSSQRIHLRNLRTGRTTSVRASLAGLSGTAVFLDSDHQIAYINDGKLEVRPVPSFTAHLYKAPAGCRYQSVTDSGRGLVAAIACGKHQDLRLVTVSGSAFKITGTVAALGTCLAAWNLSATVGRTPAFLVDAYRHCAGSPSTSSRIIEVRGHAVRVIKAGATDTLPEDVIW